MERNGEEKRIEELTEKQRERKRLDGEKREREGEGMSLRAEPLETA